MVSKVNNIKATTQTLLFFLVMSVFISCSPLGKLKKYKGMKIETVINDLGSPSNIIPTPESKIYIWEKSTLLKSTEINKGQLTLDPMVSPAVVKLERSVFTVINGIVFEIKKEVDYQKK